MNQIVTDTSPLEERVYKSDAPRGGYFLDKELYSIPLPWMLPFWADNDKKPYMEIASNLDKVIDTYYNLIGKDNTYLSSRLSSGGREGTMIISHCNMDHYDLFVDTSIGVPINREMATLPDFGYVDYNQDNEITMTFRGTFDAMTEDLLGYQAGPIHGEDEFDYFVNDLNNAIDALFVEQGFQPTPDKRHNLIGLCQNLTNHILEKEEVQRLIGVTPGTIALDNPTLVRLAAKGVTHTMIRIFCVAGVFPDSTEDLEDLASMPLEMLHDIWIGKEED